MVLLLRCECVFFRAWCALPEKWIEGGLVISENICLGQNQEHEVIPPQDFMELNSQIEVLGPLVS